jgi:hypothetical protein
MEFKNNFSQIKKAIEYNKLETEDNSLKKDDAWPQYDSPIYEFGGTFVKSLPAEYTNHLDKKIYATVEETGEPFKQYIEDTLSKSKNKELYAVEFGGSGSRLFHEFSKGFFERTAGVCLGDERYTEEKFNDAKKGHDVVIGDVLTVNGNPIYKDIENRLGTSKVDLIISRMQGPLYLLDKNPAIMNALVKKWYSMLNENGILFAQFEYMKEHNPNMEEKYKSIIEPENIRDSEIHAQYWVDEIKKRYNGLVDVQLGRGVLRLHKNFGAPEEIENMPDMFEKNK